MIGRARAVGVRLASVMPSVSVSSAASAMSAVLSMVAVSAMVFVLLTPVAGAIDIVQFDNEEHAVRYQKLTKELRCLVCQNQTIAESAADLAKDMRGVVAKMVREGKSEKEIVGFMTARYGDFVRYRPPLKTSTLVLWGGPFALVLLLLLLVLPRVMRRRRVSLTGGQLRRAEQILEEEK